MGAGRAGDSMSLKFKSVVIAIGSLALITLIFLFMALHDEERDFSAYLEQQHDTVHRLQELSRKRAAEIFTANALGIAARPPVVAMFKAHDREGLYQLLKPMHAQLYRMFADQIGICDFYLPDGSLFLQLGSSQPYPTAGKGGLLVSQALLHGTPAVGYDTGDDGLFYRIAVPVLENSTPVGAIEIGISLPAMDLAIKQLHHLQQLILYPPEYKKMVLGTGKNILLRDDGSLVDGDPGAVAIFADVGSDLLAHEKIISHRGSLYFTHLFPIDAPDGQRLATYIYLIDVTAAYRGHREEMLTHSVVALLTFAGGSLLLYGMLSLIFKQLYESETRYRNIFDNMQNGVAVFKHCSRSNDFVFRDFNRCAERIDNIAREYLLGRKLHDIYPAARQNGFSEILAEVHASGRSRHVPATFYSDGRIEGWREYHVYRLPTEEVVTIYSDVTERKAYEERLKLASKIIEHSIEGMVITDAGSRILQVNSAFTQVTGYHAEEILGERPSMLQSGRHDEEFYKTMWRSVAKRGFWQGEIWNRRKSGDVYPQWLSIFTIKDDADAISHYIGLFSDITHHEVSKNRMMQLAHYDVLTGLPNRLYFTDRLQQAVIKAKRSRNKAVLMFLDLDRFKVINDTLGHRCGDILLQQVAQRLKGCIRESDTVSRLGGDEFTIIDDAADAAVARRIAQKVLDTFRTPFDLEGNDYFVTTSIGVSVYPDDAVDTHTLLQYADTAMYKAKELGKSTCAFFTPDMQTHSIAHLELERDLRLALERGEFRLLYQPQYDIAGTRISGVEALIRWEHPQRGAISPGEFIPIAEETGLIVSLGTWVLNEACRQLALWEADGISIMMAVNVSSRQFNQNGFIELVQEALRHSGASPRLLELEVTERIVMNDTAAILDKLNKLKAMGIKLAIDDFGTGYSSLSYLKLFPIDKLKIDRSFVGDIGTDTNDEAIISAITAMGRKLQLRTIAEGVETQEQLAFLRAAGCDEAQGYFYSAPVEAETLHPLLSGASAASFS